MPGPVGPLAVHTASSSPAASASTVVLTHDFPVDVDSAERTGRSLPQLADRLAAESGWRVVAGCLRGAGASAGDFSLCGWLDDLGALVDHATGLAAGGGVWVVGFGVGGAVALCLAAADTRVRGVGSLAAPATFADWAQDPAAMVHAARRVGVIRHSGFPEHLADWAHEFTELRPVEASALTAPRPVLVVHGADDDEVPVSDARLLAEAAGRSAELRILPGAGHRLRADPRAMALLVGWLERQEP
ncbi:MAG TPA: prolyl oligopeptidase family serine peptidase [Acidimicrobiales bacterium]|nr:prolyl oligopeptidase family serine peptidase [Acidimicrobiales bacterium]